MHGIYLTIFPNLINLSLPYTLSHPIQLLTVVKKMSQQKGGKKASYRTPTPKSIPNETSNSTSPSRRKLPPLWLRVFLFLIVPSLVGGLGLLTSYLSPKIAKIFNAGTDTVDDNPINFDRDFVYPFMITLLTACVLWYQTKGFTNANPKPVVSWPKVKKKRRVIRRTVVVDEDGNEVDEENEDDEEEEEELNSTNLRRGSRKED